MGYTHYWKLKPAELPAQAEVLIGQILLDAYDHGIVQRDHDDPRLSVILYDEIRFNNVGENGHETFHFVPNSGQADGKQIFHFCKTARKPYDRAVMQVLIVLKHYLGKAITGSGQAVVATPGLTWGERPYADQRIGQVFTCPEQARWGTHKGPRSSRVSGRRHDHLTPPCNK